MRLSAVPDALRKTGREAERIADFSLQPRYMVRFLLQLTAKFECPAGLLVPLALKAQSPDRPLLQLLLQALRLLFQAQRPMRSRHKLFIELRGPSYRIRVFAFETQRPCRPLLELPL